MKIVLIGTGNAGKILGEQFVQSGHTILQLYGRDPAKAAALSRLYNCPAISNLADLTPMADLYLVAVSDDAIPEIAGQMQLSHQLVVHTAGSVSREVLKNTSTEYGVLYPLQSLQSASTKKPAIPFLIDASSRASLTKLQELVVSLGSGYQVCTDDQRLGMHLAAVWVNNFPNLLYAIAYRICQEKGLDFTLLRPLLIETAERIGETDPLALQTGPAIRNDQDTLHRHRDLLHLHPSWLELYQKLSTEIQQMGKRYSTG
ncbi:Rossmann-like and DUF2520 domain-containing protein [Flavihumibacter fluvii]|uniref:Rossmann-like and DUF2520 domain-containing protein n=1 Tax=Flavihumibacter fluvii TaxID=2838157 RepID=UPI001BDDD0F9|nr:Rossmann-like and DUF2520 domain-containing protein [Flavihumibacter fluvii]ULQ53920.1 F420-dependent NADP oxidoreductase [Flavihumibacter fluvii]